MKNVRIIFKQKSTTETLGYIRISIRTGNKTHLKSLNLSPIEKRYFNPKTQRVRSNFPEHELYNNTIENVLERYRKKGNYNFHLNDDNLSFTNFIDKVIEQTENYGTKNKYQTIKNYLVYFNTEKNNDSNVKFSDITYDFLINFRIWLTDRKIKNNTIFYIFKSLKGLVNKGIKQKHYSYDFDPFGLVQNKLEENPLTSLTIDEVKTIINTDIREVYRGGKNNGKLITDEKVLNDIRYRRGNSLEDIKNYFLFSIFNNGFRVSDTISLRWNDFYILEDEIRIQKRMIKTKKNVDTFVNYNVLNILKNYIPTHLLNEEMLNKINSLHSINPKEISNVDKTTKIKLPLDSEIMNRLDFDYSDGNYWVSIEDVEIYKKERLDKIFNEIGMSDFELKDSMLYSIKNNNFGKQDKDSLDFKLNQNIDIVKIKSLVKEDEIIKYLDNLTNILSTHITSKNTKITDYKNEIDVKNYLIYLDIINYLSQNEMTKNLFCFNVLKDTDFSDIDEKNDFGRMSEYQYSKFISGRTYYNSLLKYVIKQCGISKKVTTHTSRHTYTSLMIQNGEKLNLYDVMTSLGHTSLNTTEKYINKFKSKRVDDFSKKLSDIFNK
jgi:integrase